ncbi:MAG: diguanylate cyclase [Stappiaceae bacterium]
MTHSFKRRAALLIVAAAIFFGGMSAVEFVGHVLEKNARDQQLASVYSRLSSIRSRLETEVNAVFYLSQGLVSTVALDPDMDRKTFDAITMEIVGSYPFIQTVGLVRETQFKYIHPFDQFKGLLHVDLSKDPNWAPQLQQLRAGEKVFFGPMDFVTGKTGFLLRNPVFISDDSARKKDEFWGFVSMSIWQENLFSTAGFSTENRGLLMALRRQSGALGVSVPIAGDQEVFKQDAVKMPISFPSGAWEIAAVPVGGWGKNLPEILTVRFVGYGFAFAIAALSFFLLEMYFHTRFVSEHDHMTGLPNRRRLMRRLEKLALDTRKFGTTFSVLFVDLNGFKPINDRYGHQTGDALLAAIGERLVQNVPNDSLVARIGGDEFVVVVSGNCTNEYLVKLGHKLSSIVSQRLDIGGESISVGSSFGCARFPGDAGTIDELLSMADTRMYEMKNQRNIAYV